MFDQKCKSIFQHMWWYVLFCFADEQQSIWQKYYIPGTISNSVFRLRVYSNAGIRCSAFRHISTWNLSKTIRQHCLYHIRSHIYFVQFRLLDVVMLSHLIVFKEKYNIKRYCKSYLYQFKIHGISWIFKSFEIHKSLAIFRFI